MKQSEILLINDVIGRHIASGGKSELLQEDWDYLQLHVALYINSEMSGIPMSMQVLEPASIRVGLGDPPWTALALTTYTLRKKSVL